jgi:hypothetical protein
VTSRSTPGWIYVMAHPAWDKIGMVKIGKTGRDPLTRAAEITSVSGLLAPCTIAWCSPVSDMAAAETALHRMLGDKRVRKRRELFRVDSATARQVVEAVAASLPSSRSPFSRLASVIPTRPRTPVSRYRARGGRSASWRYGRRRVSPLVRLVAGVVAIGALILLRPLLHI